MANRSTKFKFHLANWSAKGLDFLNKLKKIEVFQDT